MQQVSTPLVSMTISLVSNTASSVIVKLPICPLFTVRSLLQCQPDQLTKQFDDKNMNAVAILQKIKKDQGISSWFRGFEIELLANVVNKLCAPFIMEIYQRIPRFNSQTDFFKYYMKIVVGGGLLGAFSQAITRPLTYSRFKLASDTIGERQYSGMMDVLQKTVKANGYSALFSGFDIAILKTIIYRLSYFGLYDIFRKLNPYPDSFNARFFIVQLVVFTNMLICYPFETVERKLQLEADKKEKQFSSSFDCFRKTFEKEGIFGFFGGFKENIAMTLISAGGLIIYDMLVR